MIAQNNPTLMQASKDLYEINGDELMRQKARARADAEFWERNKNARLKKQEEIIEEQKLLMEEKDALIRKLQSQLREKI